jgi:CRP-like cAMP-binding protein
LRTLSLMERVHFLRRVALFADLAPADLKHVALVAVERSYPSGETIVRQGEPGDEMFVIVSGEVRIVVTPANGPPREVARRATGDYLGEMAIVDREPRSATLIAVDDVRMLCLGHQQFESILRERPDTGLVVMRELCRRLRLSQEQGLGSRGGGAAVGPG